MTNKIKIKNKKYHARSTSTRLSLSIERDSIVLGRHSKKQGRRGSDPYRNRKRRNRKRRNRKRTPIKPKQEQEREAEEEEESLIPEEPKKKHPLDNLPKSSFNLEDWKREYSNLDSRGSGSSLEWFYER